MSLNIVSNINIDIFLKVSLTYSKNFWKIINCNNFYIIYKMVELKSGDTYNGTLDEIDRFMNIKLSEVTFSSKVCIININIKE